MELPLMEIFYSLSVIETDAPKIWGAMLKNYPPGHFDGVLEDKYGGRLSGDMEKDIRTRLEISLEDCQKLVIKSTERLSIQMRMKDLLLKQRNTEYEKLKERHQHETKLLVEDMRMQYEYKLRELERTVTLRYGM